MIRVGILGSTGYGGEELIRLLNNHKNVDIVKIMSKSYMGKNYCDIFRNYTGLYDKVCVEYNIDNIAEGIDLLFTALPYGVLSNELSVNILNKVNIIDIGADYRIKDKSSYEKWYKKEHRSFNLTSKFVYGLCEWNRKIIKKSKYIANPGCYATAVLFSLLPLIKESIIEKGNIIIDGKGALSASGRTLSLGTHYIEATESIKAYNITKHRHIAEIEQTINNITGENICISFTPHIIPMSRGILTTAYVNLNSSYNYENIKCIYEKYYKNEKFITILKKGHYVETKWVKNSNMIHINFEIDERNNRLVVLTAIDNLIRGAAGQAIQNMNIMYDFSEDEGLNIIPSCI